jgi:hypothetical protein
MHAPRHIYASTATRRDFRRRRYRRRETWLHLTAVTTLTALALASAELLRTLA